ncbi:hypothetical protein V8J88_01350 [Massilia sp. W12]|uniref:hypothetical protein n=1 Tax=Massilia sp. W12 TaxID=3126507 RepID=UPI0030CE7850
MNIENVCGSAFGDTLVGNSTANKLEGMDGNDTLIGEGGADVYSFSAASGQDVISDFNRAQGDKIWLKSNLNSSGICERGGCLKPRQRRHECRD